MQEATNYPEHQGHHWNIRGAAGYLAMSESFIRKQVRLRRIPFFRVGSKALRFRKADLDAWLQRNAETGVRG